MDEENRIFVKADIERYEQLITTEEDYNLLVSVLLETARLSYDKKELIFCDSSIMSIMRAVAPYGVQRRIAELKEAETAKADN